MSTPNNNSGTGSNGSSADSSVQQQHTEFSAEELQDIMEFATSAAASVAAVSNSLVTNHPTSSAASSEDAKRQPMPSGNDSVAGPLGGVVMNPLHHLQQQPHLMDPSSMLLQQQQHYEQHNSNEGTPTLQQRPLQDFDPLDSRADEASVAQPPQFAAAATTQRKTDTTAELVSLSREQKAAARTERKRTREKQRRSDVNRQFSELSNCLRKLDTANAAAAAAELAADGATLPNHQLLYSSPSNRADLIARTIYLLTSMDSTIKRQKVEIRNLNAGLEQSKKTGEETAVKLKEALITPHAVGNSRVMMMVPMMIGPNGAATPVPGMTPGMPSTTAAPADGGAVPWMQQQQLMAQQYGGMMMAAAQPQVFAAPAAAPTDAPPAEPYFMPHMMQQQQVAVAPTTVQPPPSEETKRAASDTDENTSSGGGNLAHCA